MKLNDKYYKYKYVGPITIRKLKLKWAKLRVRQRIAISEQAGAHSDVGYASTGLMHCCQYRQCIHLGSGWSQRSIRNPKVQQSRRHSEKVVGQSIRRWLVCNLWQKLWNLCNSLARFFYSLFIWLVTFLLFQSSLIIYAVL